MFYQKSFQFCFNMEKEYKYIITETQTFHNNGQTEKDGEVSSFLIRICDTLEDAKTILKSAYAQALGEQVSRYGFRSSNPKWINDEDKIERWQNMRLEFTKKGPYGCSWDIILEIHQEREKNYLATHSWYE